MPEETVVVLGGGTGGLVATRRLRRLVDPSDRVVLVERDPTFRFAPSFLWVMTGARRPEQVTADVRRLRRRGVEGLQAEVLELNPDQRRVKTSEAELTYDRLVVSLGAELAPELLRTGKPPTPPATTTRTPAPRSTSADRGATGISPRSASSSTGCADGSENAASRRHPARAQPLSTR